MKFLVILSIFVINTLSAQIITPSSDSGRGASVAYSLSSSSIINNPSFLSFLQDDFISIGYSKYYNPSFFYSFNIGYAKKVNKDGGVGILWQRFSIDDDFEYFDYKENHFYISYGHVLSKHFRPGARFKVFNIDTISGSGMGYSLSFSFLFVPIQTYFISLVLENLISSKIRWTTSKEEDFKKNFIIGMGYRLLFNRLKIILSCDYLVENIKIGKFVISDDYSYGCIKGGVSFHYSLLGVSFGIIKNRKYNYLSGMDVKILHDCKAGLNYIYNANELGDTFGFYFEYAN